MTLYFQNGGIASRAAGGRRQLPASPPSVCGVRWL